MSFLSGLFSKKQPESGPDDQVVLNQSEIHELMDSTFSVYNQIQLDGSYMTVSEKWVTDIFAPQFQKFMNTVAKSVGSVGFSEETNDCDNYSGWSRLFAQAMNNAGPNCGKAALAFGEFIYKRDIDLGKSGHDVNFFITRSQGVNQIRFFEPQLVRIIGLSKRELDSATAWII